MEKILTTTLTRPLVQEKPAPVRGPGLGGVLRWIGIGFWLGTYLLSLQLEPRPEGGTLVIACLPMDVR